VLIFDISAVSNALPFVKDSLGLDDGACSSPGGLLGASAGAVADATNGTALRRMLDAHGGGGLPDASAANATAVGCKAKDPLPLFVALLLPSER